MSHRTVAGIAGFLVLAGVLAAGQAPAPEVDLAREYPSYDWQLLDQVQRGMNAREAERAWREAPGAGSTMQRLVEANRIDDAIRSLEAGTRGTFNELMAVLDVLREKFSSFQIDASRGYLERVAAIVTPLRARIGSLPREDAARLAWTLMLIEGQLNNRGSRGWRDRVTAYVDEYRGTRQGLLAEVDSLSANSLAPGTLAAYDAFAAGHAGTEAAAYAIYQKGFNLAFNGQTVGGEPYGGDPLNRFLQVVAIVDDLESGKYPDGEGVRQAPGLIVGFHFRSSPPSAFQPGSIDRMLAEYQRFARSHFTPATAVDLGNSVGYLLTSLMAQLFALQGDHIAGVEKSVTDLEAHGADKGAVALLRAEFLMREALGGTEAWRAALVPKAEAALVSLAAAGTDFYSRKAAALNAGRLMYQRDYTRAKAAFDSYASRFPASPWAWVARLRAAQCLLELGDLNRAAPAFEAVASGGAAEPLAGIIGSALAAQTYDAMGQFDRSLPAYRRALDAWSNDYGPDLTPTPSRVSVPAPATGESTMRRAVTQQNLEDRVASLERNLKTSVGPMLERAAWQIDARRFTDARNTLAQAANVSRTDVDRSAVRTLDRRTQLEIAMEILAIEGASADVTSGVKALDNISSAPFDANVGFAGLAKATVMFKNGANEAARLLMTSTLNEWRESQRALRGSSPTSPMAADVTAIRNVIFRPGGSFELIAKSSWNAYTTPSSLVYAVVNPDVRVMTAGGKLTRLTVYQDFPELTKTIFWTTEDIAFASRLIVTLGGTRRMVTRSVMETPNQPAGAAVDVMNFWNGFFATRQGHWGGWVVETYPIINSITFLDEARTRAGVAITVGYSGATVIMEKKNGTWQAVRLVNQWIT